MLAAFTTLIVWAVAAVAAFVLSRNGLELLKNYLRLRTLISRIGVRTAAENEKLIAVGASVPLVMEPASFTLSVRNSLFRPMKFALPHSLYISVSREVFTAGGFFLISDAAGVQRAIALESSAGLGAVVQSFPQGVWFNRDPYEYYKWFNGMPPNPGFFVVPDNILETVPGLDLSELCTRAWRLQFYTDLLRDFRFPIRIYDKPYQDLKQFLSNNRTRAYLPKFDLPNDRITVRILISDDTKPAASERFLDALHNLEDWIAFSVVAKQPSISFYLTFTAKFKEQVVSILKGCFPEFSVVETEQPAAPEDAKTFDLTPASAFGTLATLRSMPFDALKILLRILDCQPRSAFTSLQMLFHPNDQGFLANLEREFLLLQTDVEYSDEPEITIRREVPTHFLTYGCRKELWPTFKAKFPTAWWTHVCLVSTDPGVLRDLEKQYLPQYRTANRSLSTLNSRYDSKRFELFGTDEIASLIHFPGKESIVEGLEMANAKSRNPPESYTTGAGNIIGNTEHRGFAFEIKLPDSVRDRHVYVIGKSGTGKSTLLFNLARQDMARGFGLCVIDPHGDLVEDLIAHVPKSRVDDVIYFDPSDLERPIGLAIMQARNEIEVARLSSELKSTVRRLSETWGGSRMEHVLDHCFMTLLEAGDTTFLDVYDLLVRAEFRKDLLKRVRNPNLQGFWREEFESLPKDAKQPIITRMSKYRNSPVLSRILGQKNSKLDFSTILDYKKILLVNLGKVETGEEDKQLLGSLLISQFQLAIMRRSGVPEERRVPFYLYVDEFEKFMATSADAFASLLSEARKYKLCLTLAHQYISQLDDRVKSAIFGNVGTMIMFNSEASESSKLKEALGRYAPQDLGDLLPYNVLLRPGRSSETFEFATCPKPSPQAEDFRAEIVSNTRERYGRPVSATESGTRETGEIAAQKRLSEQLPLVPQTPEQEGAVSSLAAVDNKSEPVGIPVPLPSRADATHEPTPGRVLPGRGGRQHKYLQQLIGLWGDEKGYKVSVEKEILGGIGRVDVALERGPCTIACEISISTTPEHELQNIQKCLAAGFSIVVVISTDKKHLQQTKDLLSGALGDQDSARVRCLAPEDFYLFLEDTEAAVQPKEETVKGYKVKTKFKTVSAAEQKSRKNAIAQTILQALKRLKD